MHFSFFFLICFIRILPSEIIIKDKGVATLTRGDVGMIFYITLQNNNDNKYHIHIKMVKCCETFGENDMDCQLMYLMGGDMGYLQPNVTRNISLLYPNMYLHNRKGRCLISITSIDCRNVTENLKEKICFDTIISETHQKPVLNGYYNKKEFRKCKTIDQDPLDNCEPVNCLMKYLGRRNYFNHKWKRCQKVPICIADPAKDLPDVAYVPTSNKCRDLENLITVDDLKYLEKGLIEGEWNNERILPTNLRCHHGTLNNETGFCVCNEGWMSAPVDKDQYKPSLAIYHMCNIQISTWNDMNSTKFKMTALIVAILGAGFAMFMIALAFICHALYNCIRPDRSRSKKRSSSISFRSEESPMNKSDDSVQSITERPDPTSSGSVQNAATRDSLIFHRRKSMDPLLGRKFYDIEDERVNDSSLRIIRTLSLPLSSATRTQGYDESGTTSSLETEDQIDITETESFQPRRTSRDD